MNASLVLLLLLIAMLYVCIYFLDKYFKMKSQSYTNFITKHNIRVHFLYITLHTKTFNRMIYKISHMNVTKRCHCIKYTYIYNTGVLCTLVCIPVSIYIIGQSVYSNLVKPQSSSLYVNDNEEHYINVKPLVIGVNLPMSHLLYYISSLLVCIVIHELGHAICALHENIRLNHVGIIVIFIIPVIYVDIENISTTQVPVSLLAKLRIYCAGIWHNILLTLLMYFILYTFPLTISPLYSINEGVQVTHIGFDSPLKSTAGKFGLEPFDVIVKINECRVHNEVTFQKCLRQLSTSKKVTGYCLTDEFIEKHEETLITEQDSDDCCAKNQTKHLCFVQLSTNATPLSTNVISSAHRVKRHVGNNAHRENKDHDEIGELKIRIDSTPETTGERSKIQPTVKNADPSVSVFPKENIANKTKVKTGGKYCIKARLALDNSKRTCVTSDQCSPAQCYSPQTSHGLIQIHVRHKAPYVLYLGRPSDVYNSLSVSNYIHSYRYIILSYLPSMGYNMAVYISMLSSGLALVNAVPCYYFDSQHIVSVLVTRSACLRFCIHALSTVLLVTYFLLFIPSTLLTSATGKVTR